MLKHATTILMLVAALALYAAGMAIPASALVLLGIVAEGIFWFRLFRSGKRHQ
jgi:hypothetical protein